MTRHTPDQQGGLWQSPVWRWGRWPLLGFLVLRLIFWGLTFPNPDEAYYWLWGQHWDWSYYDHPGFQAWGQGLLTTLLGRSRFVLRLSNLLSTTLVVVTLHRITTYLYGPQARDRVWLALLLVASSPLFFLFLALAWHDHWLIAFALLSSFYFVRFADAYAKDRSGATIDLMAAALFLGLAGLCKYTALLLGLSFAASLLSQRSLRRLYLDPRLYLALGLVVIVLSRSGMELAARVFFLAVLRRSHQPHRQRLPTLATTPGVSGPLCPDSRPYPGLGDRSPGPVTYRRSIPIAPHLGLPPASLVAIWPLHRWLYGALPGVGCPLLLEHPGLSPAVSPADRPVLRGHSGGCSLAAATPGHRPGAGPVHSDRPDLPLQPHPPHRWLHQGRWRQCRPLRMAPDQRPGAEDRRPPSPAPAAHHRLPIGGGPGL